MNTIRTRGANIYSKTCIHLILAVTLAFLMGCGEKEDKDIIEARSAIVRGDYNAAQTAVQKAAANTNPASRNASQEARIMNSFLKLRTNTETADWHKAITQSLAHLETLHTDIHAISMHEDPDSDELDRKERLIRSRNAISGLFIMALADAVKKRVELLPELISPAANRIHTSASIISLLEAEKCYQPTVRKTLAQLMEKLISPGGRTAGANSPIAKLLIQETQNTDTAIRKEAIYHLGTMQHTEFIPIFEAVLAKPDEATAVAYRAVTALEQLNDPAVVPALQMALKNDSAQVRMHAAKLIGHHFQAYSEMNAAEAETIVYELLRLLADSNGYVRDTAIEALNRIGDAALLLLLEVIETQARNLIPDEDTASQAAAPSTEYRYIASAYIDDSWMKKYRIGAQAAAIGALGKLKSEAGVAPLIARLADEDLQADALAALIEMQGTAMNPLLDALKNGTTKIRVKVAEALGTIGDRRAIMPLIDALNTDSHKEVKALAAKALGDMHARGKNNLAVTALTQALTYDDTTVANAAEALGKINVQTERAVQKLIIISMDKQRRETVRLAAINALAQLKPPKATQPMLLLLLSDETSPVIRANAAKVLSRIKAPETVPALLWVLSTQFDEISDFQRYMKREYKTLDGLRTQVDSLKIQWTADYPRANYRTWGELKPIPSLVRSEVARTLGIIKGDTVIEPLIQALDKDQRATVRQSAAWALGEVKGEPTIAPLVTALKKDKQGAVRQEAAIALGKIKGQAVVAPLLDVLKNDKYETTRLEAAKALREIQNADEGLVDIIKKGLGSFDEGYEVQSVQNEVIGALIKDGNAATAQFALDALKTANDEWTRWALVHVLGSTAKKLAVDAMVAELNHSSYVIRKRATKSLGGFRERRTVEPLIAMLTNGDEMKSIRAAAADSLGVLKDESAATPLLAALEDENAEVRLQAAAALGKIRDAKAVPKLSTMVENSLETDEVRATAAAALGNIGDKTAEAVLMKALDIRVGNIANNAIVALGQLKSEAALPKLIAILEDKRVPLDASTDALAKASARTKAAIALGEIGGELAAEAIGKRLIDDTEYIVALQDEVERRTVGNDSLKRNWNWEGYVNAAKKLELPAFVAPKMAVRAADEWESHQVQNAAMVALGKCSGPELTDVSQFKQRLTDPDVDIRKATALSIGQAGIAVLTPDLIQIMTGQSEAEKDVRRAATQALGEFADIETTDVLIKVMNNDENHVEIRRDASRALGKIGIDKAVDALVQKLTALHETQLLRGFRLDLIKALGDAKNARGVQLLELILEDQDAEIHFQAASALFEITGKGYGYNRL